MNPNSIPWLHYQDIQIPDVKIKNQFDFHVKNGQYVEALALLKDKEQQLKGKAYIADCINKIINGILILQSKYTFGVTVFLSDLAARYFNLIDTLGKRGTWNDSVDYEPYNFVDYNEKVYMAIKEPPIGVAPSDNEYWVELNIEGEDGAPGTDLTMRYDWSDKRTYQPHDLVVYERQIYVALKENTNVMPTDTANWLLFLSIEKGRIHVGMTEPDKKAQNTVWFKTEVDPLASTEPVVGQFMRYTFDGKWEEMYPAVLFSRVVGSDKYAPYVVIEKATVKPEDWGLQDGKYVYTYNSSNIKQNSVVMVIPDGAFTDEQNALYAKLSIEVTVGAFKLICAFEPEQELKLNIRVQ